MPAIAGYWDEKPVRDSDGHVLTFGAWFAQQDDATRREGLSGVTFFAGRRDGSSFSLTATTCKRFGLATPLCRVK